MKFQTYRPKILFEKKSYELLAALLHSLLSVMGGLLLAHWAWLVFAPITLKVPAKLEQTTSMQLSTVLAAHWFSPASGQLTIAAAPINFKLVGIYASSSNKPGFAIFKLADGKQRAVLLHQEISPGNPLQSVEPDGVEIGQEGNTQKLLLENRKASGSGPHSSMPHF